MKNWIIFIVIFLLSLSLAISVIIFWKANEPIKKIESEATELVLSSQLLTTVSDSYVYNGNKPYVTVFGVDEGGKEKALFVPITLEEKAIQQVLLEDGITIEQALSVIDEQSDVKKILHTKLGYEEIGPVWEITYMNDSERLNYVYILFENGQWWKRILNL